MTAILGGFSEVAANYDVAIIDLWGVVHDGTKPYPDVLDCLERMKQSGNLRLFLSNAPRRASAVIAQIERIGVPPSAYDGVISSGEIAFQELSRGIPGIDQRAAYFYVGPEKDRQILAGLDYRETDAIEAADFLLVTGFRADETETVADYEDELRAAADCSLPFLCANPDLRVMRGDKILFCAGALAARYEELGGKVQQFGKPFRAAYEACLAGRDVPLSRVVAIGDTPRTDLAGAMAYGIDSIFVAGGLHREDVGAPIDPVRLRQFLDASGTVPVAALEVLCWAG